MAAVACVDEGHATSPEQIREYMSGNLCRCGAYVGIVAAIHGRRVEDAEGVPMQSFRLYKTRKRRGGRSRNRRAAGPGTRFLAGGTTLYDLMKLNVETPSSIIDINSLAELERLRHLRFERIDVRRLGTDERRRCGSRSDSRLSCAIGVAVEGGLAATSQHGKPWRQPASAHALRLLSWRRAVRLQQARARQRLRRSARYQSRPCPARRQRGVHRRLSRRPWRSLSSPSMQVSTCSVPMVKER